MSTEENSKNSTEKSDFMDRLEKMFNAAVSQEATQESTQEQTQETSATEQTETKSEESNESEENEVSATEQANLDNQEAQKAVDNQLAIQEQADKAEELERTIEKQVDELKVYKTCLAEGITDPQIIDDMTSLLNGEPTNIIKLLAKAQKETASAREQAGKVVEIKEQQEEKKAQPSKIRHV